MSDQPETIDHTTQVTVEGDLDPAQQQILKEMSDEKQISEKFNIVKVPEEVIEDEFGPTTNLDASGSNAETKEKTETSETQDGDVSEGSGRPDSKKEEETPAPETNESGINQDAFSEFLKSQELDEDKFAEAFLKSGKLKLNMKGKEREITLHDVKSALGREESFQKKFASLSASDEMRLGTIMTAAKGGDKGAQKKLQNMLIEFTGSEDVDGMADKLEEVKGEFNEEERLAEKNEDQEFELAFADVQNDVDFQNHMAIIEGDLKGRLPVKVYESFYNSPLSRRTMYDLAASGRLEPLMDAFDQELSTLSFEKRLEINGDPDRYANAFLDVVRQQNAKQAKADEPEGENAGEPKKDAMDSVSSGNRGRRQPAVDSSNSVQGTTAQEIKKMSPEEFEKFHAKVSRSF